MALRTGHGTGAGQPRVEVLPPDELPAPVPAPPGGESAGKPAAERREGGQFAPGPGTRALSAIANQTKAKKIRLVDSLGLAAIAQDSTFGPYRTAAEEFVKHHVEVLAVQAGGQVGPAPSTMVASAALQLAASRWAFDQGALTGDPALLKLGSQLANDSRQNLLAAYELAVREAAARPKADPFAELRAIAAKGTTE